MGDLVCDGTEFSCPFCTSKLKLKVLSSKVTGEGKKIANMGNCLFPPPGGNCTVVPSAPVPCTPAATPIDQGQKNVTVDQLPALGAGCKFQCAKGGLLTVSSSGQTQGKHDEATGAPLFSMAGAITPFFSALPPKKKEENEEENEGAGSNPPPQKKTPRPATTPVGSRRTPHTTSIFQKTRNAPQTINKRNYSAHAVDQMQNRGITPRVVENTIKNGDSQVIMRNNKLTTRYYDSNNNITVVTNSEDRVITIGHGLMGRKFGK